MNNEGKWIQTKKIAAKKSKKSKKSKSKKSRKSKSASSQSVSDRESQHGMTQSFSAVIEQCDELKILQTQLHSVLHNILDHLTSNLEHNADDPLQAMFIDGNTKAMHQIAKYQKLVTQHQELAQQSQAEAQSARQAMEEMRKNVNDVRSLNKKHQQTIRRMEDKIEDLQNRALPSSSRVPIAKHKRPRRRISRIIDRSEELSLEVLGIDPNTGNGRGDVVEIEDGVVFDEQKDIELAEGTYCTSHLL